MAKIYNTNYGLELARAKVFNALDAEKKVNILDAVEFSSGDYLPKSKMTDGPFLVYGGGGLTQSTHTEYNIDKRTIGIGRVGARCGCVFIIERKSWVTDNALYVSKFKKDYDLSFLMHYLNFLNLNQFANQSAQPVISQRGIAKCTIPDIELNDQVQIGRILDAVANQEDFEDVYGLKPILSFEKDTSALQEEVEQQQIYLQLLRQAILQEAVQGKLVPQVEADEPASELLKRIKAEKQKLVKEGKLKKEKELPPITEGEMPFELPKGWVWCRLGEVCSSIVPNRDKPKTFSGGVRWVTLPDFHEDWIYLKSNMNSIGLSNEEVVKYNARVITPGNVIMSCVGRFGLVAVVREKIVPNQQIHGFIVPQVINAEFIALVIKANKTYYESLSQATTIAYLNKTNCESLMFALPPLSDQQHIVNKVNLLMKYIDQLEQQIVYSQAQTQQLLQAVLKEAFEGNYKEYTGAEELTLAAEV